VELVKIPSERVRALMENDGEAKALIERLAKVSISVSDEGDVEITGESVDEYFARDIIKAIGRGFSPNDALLLLKEDYTLKIINLKEYVHSDEAVRRLKGVIIGEKGKTKLTIEEVTRAHLSIYGKTVGVIAPLDSIDIAITAIFKFIEGASHSTVYTYLEKNRRRLQEME
jgi:ribosomal RNA assembly protein